MCEILSERLDHSLDLLVAAPAGDYGQAIGLVAIDTLDHAAADSFQNLLAELEQFPADGDRGHVIERYQGWIERADANSDELFAAWFNIGVELVKVGDMTGAISAYRNVLAARPGFGPAAFNLSMLLQSQDAGPEREGAPLGGNQEQAAHTIHFIQETMDVLHVGCGVACREALPPVFRKEGWREVRLDIDPAVAPDFIASTTDMHVIADGAADAVYSSHNVEHLYPHEVVVALGEMRRVLKPSGFALIMVPDLQAVAQFVADGKLEETLYLSSMGPIAPLDMLYGHRQSMANGNTFMAHRTGFTCGTLASALLNAGFAAALVQRDSAALSLTAIAFRTLPDEARLAQARTEMLSASLHPAVVYLPAA